ncbi:cystatin-B-like [Pygocentrus nattereri]|uniref:cystatin-B-like n=1 Tax=Pygocentrus nattereri TaxID=42514 RepID=UPI00081441A4|nr:cystatin-B-like [Pygocentrus nattereri]
MSVKPYTANQNIQTYCDEVKPRVDSRTGKTHDVFIAKTYITKPGDQTVYLVKVHVGGDTYYHVKLMKNPAALWNKAVLQSTQIGMKLNDPLQF